MNGCEKCQDVFKRQDASERKILFEKISSEIEEYFEGKAHETHTWYRCKECGTKWFHLRESGLGGSGSFWYIEKDSPFPFVQHCK